MFSNTKLKDMHYEYSAAPGNAQSTVWMYAECLPGKLHPCLVLFGQFYCRLGEDAQVRSQVRTHYTHGYHTANHTTRI